MIKNHQQLYCVSSRVWTDPSPCSWKFWKIQDDFDPGGQLDSIAPLARSNPTARRGRNLPELFKIFMSIGTVLSTLSMGNSIVKCFDRQKLRIRLVVCFRTTKGPIPLQKELLFEKKIQCDSGWTWWSGRGALRGAADQANSDALTVGRTAGTFYPTL